MQQISWLIFIASCLAVCAPARAIEPSASVNAAVEPFDAFQGAIPVRLFNFERDDDQDYDRQPDDWVRRKGIEFRQYVEAELDYSQAAGGKRSLRIDANGSGAIYYSPPIPIDAAHCYVMQASVLTRGLKFNAAAVSFSFLNHRKIRIHRIVTPPVSGTHRDWLELKIPPFTPDPTTKFVVIGCHLIPSSNTDIHGSAWFDEISISKLPCLKLASNFETHFRQSNSDITIHSLATGLDQQHHGEQFDYRLQLQVQDVNGNTLDHTTYQLGRSAANPASTTTTKSDVAQQAATAPDAEAATTADPASEQTAATQSDHSAKKLLWELPVYPPGFYRVNAALVRNDSTVVKKSTSFAVLNLEGRAPLQGEFGWTLAGSEHAIDSRDLLAITRESGINWLKVPVWRDAYSLDPSQTGQFLTALRNQSINPIGMLSDPPEQMRKKFPADWNGISELFVAPPVVWRQEVNQVMALYSPTVTRWQLGDDRDTSFVGMAKFDQTLEKIREELQRIGQIRQLGVRWNMGSAVEQNQTLNRNFLTFVSDGTQSVEEVTASVKAAQTAGYEAWVLVKPDPLVSENDPFMRANLLVQRLIDAKRTGCDLVLAYDVLDPKYGLLNEDGSPSEVFLPWRTVAWALNDSQYAGSIQLPNNSPNHVFLRKDDAVLVAWSEESDTEEIYLGDDVIEHSMWGDKRRLNSDPLTGRNRLELTSVPKILTGCSKQMMAWRMGTRFEKGRISSSIAEHEDTLLVKNSFNWTIQGTAKVLPANGWEFAPMQMSFSEAAGAEMALPFNIKLPSHSNLGEQLLAIEFNLGGGGLSHPFRVYRNYAVGLGDVRMEIVISPNDDGSVLVEQIITNQTKPAEMIDFRCQLMIRGQRRQNRNIRGLVSGQTRKVSYLVRDFEQLRTKDFWLRAEQQNGRRILNEIFDEPQVRKRLELSTEIEQ